MTALATRRLRLEPLTIADADALHAHWSDPAVRRYLWDGEIVARARVEEAIATSERLFARHGAGLWNVRLLHAPELMGSAGYWPYHDPPQLELMYSLSPVYWGRGLAREAATVLIDFAFERLGWDHVQASADAPNTASLALIRRLGMTRVGEVPGAFGTIEVYRVERERWGDGGAGPCERAGPDEATSPG